MSPHFASEVLPARCGSQRPSTYAFESGLHDFSSYPHILGPSDAKDLGSCHPRIILHAAIAARDELIAFWIGTYNPVQSEPLHTLCKNDIVLS